MTAKITIDLAVILTFVSQIVKLSLKEFNSEGKKCKGG